MAAGALAAAQALLGLATSGDASLEIDDECLGSSEGTQGKPRHSKVAFFGGLICPYLVHDGMW